MKKALSLELFMDNLNLDAASSVVGDSFSADLFNSLQTFSLAPPNTPTSAYGAEEGAPAAALGAGSDSEDNFSLSLTRNWTSKKNRLSSLSTASAPVLPPRRQPNNGGASSSSSSSSLARMSFQSLDPRSSPTTSETPLHPSLSLSLQQMMLLDDQVSNGTASTTLTHSRSKLAFDFNNQDEEETSPAPLKNDFEDMLASSSNTKFLATSSTTPSSPEERKSSSLSRKAVTKSISTSTIPDHFDLLLASAGTKRLSATPNRLSSDVSANYYQPEIKATRKARPTSMMNFITRVTSIAKKRTSTTLSSFSSEDYQKSIHGVGIATSFTPRGNVSSASVDSSKTVDFSSEPVEIISPLVAEPSEIELEMEDLEEEAKSPTFFFTPPPPRELPPKDLLTKMTTDISLPALDIPSPLLEKEEELVLEETPKANFEARPSIVSMEYFDAQSSLNNNQPLLETPVSPVASFHSSFALETVEVAVSSGIEVQTDSPPTSEKECQGTLFSVTEFSTQTGIEFESCYSFSCSKVGSMTSPCYSYSCPRRNPKSQEIATQTDAPAVNEEESALNEEQAERNTLLEAENLRLIQELATMKMMMTSARSQVSQLTLLKEAAESRFEQLARVAHRKLVRAMVDN